MWTALHWIDERKILAVLSYLPRERISAEERKLILQKQDLAHEGRSYAAIEDLVARPSQHTAHARAVK